MNKQSKIIIPGAAGLVGQNLIILLKEKGYQNIVAIDQHAYNIKYLRKLHSDITIIEADVSVRGSWMNSFEDGDVLIMLQAQITGKTSEPFVKNNITATELILETAKQHNIPYIVHISSSVVISVADDDYTRTKTDQEEIVKNFGIKFCALRPTLMFGWFDRKHLGWLSRFMKKIPFFPIPGDGKFMRQPLYAKDFANVIIAAMEQQPDGQVYNITGKERIDYVDIIKYIKKAKNAKTIIIHIPIQLFSFLLKVYALFSKKPPFTADQLKALTAGDDFPEDPWWEEFKVEPTPFKDAMWETHHDPKYSKYILKR